MNSVIANSVPIQWLYALWARTARRWTVGFSFLYINTYCTCLNGSGAVLYLLPANMAAALAPRWPAPVTIRQAWRDRRIKYDGSYVSLRLRATILMKIYDSLSSRAWTRRRNRGLRQWWCAVHWPLEERSTRGGKPGRERLSDEHLRENRESGWRQAPAIERSSEAGENRGRWWQRCGSLSWCLVDSAELTAAEGRTPRRLSSRRTENRMNVRYQKRMGDGQKKRIIYIYPVRCGCQQQQQHEQQ